MSALAEEVFQLSEQLIRVLSREELRQFSLVGAILWNL